MHSSASPGGEASFSFLLQWRNAVLTIQTASCDGELAVQQHYLSNIITRTTTHSNRTLASAPQPAATLPQLALTLQQQSQQHYLSQRSPLATLPQLALTLSNITLASAHPQQHYLSQRSTQAAATLPQQHCLSQRAPCSSLSNITVATLPWQHYLSNIPLASAPPPMQQQQQSQQQPTSSTVLLGRCSIPRRSFSFTGGDKLEKHNLMLSITDTVRRDAMLEGAHSSSVEPSLL